MTIIVRRALQPLASYGAEQLGPPARAR
eukprot:COSAG02_NODE_33441_length_500_cov_0.678304_2_plen_27_part_01